MQIKKKGITKNKNLLAYIIGVALGDGNLSNPNGRATRLRISCDLKYPKLIEKMTCAIQLALPDNKVTINQQPKNCAVISCYSNYWEKILGWKVGGSKFSQSASVPEWIKSRCKYKINCLRGLLETDGSIYFDRGYKMVIFKNIVLNLAKDVFDMILSLGFKPKFYEVKPTKSKKYKFNQQKAYHVRLSKDVEKFIKTIKLSKS